MASVDILGPITRVSFLVVQQSADAQLFGGGAVPASPVPCARRLVTEYSIQPIAVFSSYRTVGLSFSIAVVRPPRVVTSLGDTPMFSRIDQTIRAVVQLRLTVHALPITITVSRVSYHLVFGFTRVFLYIGRLQLLLAGALLNQVSGENHPQTCVALHRCRGNNNEQ